MIVLQSVIDIKLAHESIKILLIPVMVSVLQRRTLTMTVFYVIKVNMTGIKFCYFYNV